ncbi:MAG: hypothetical protein ABUS79_08740, partial [Pseudomonadota bacterium]
MVHAARAETVLLLRQEEVHLPRRDVREPQLPERRPDDVLADARLARARSRLPQELLDPPLHQLVDRPAAVRQLHGLEPLSLPVDLGFQLHGEALRL